MLAQAITCLTKLFGGDVRCVTPFALHVMLCTCTSCDTTFRRDTAAIDAQAITFLTRLLGGDVPCITDFARHVVFTVGRPQKLLSQLTRNVLARYPCRVASCRTGQHTGNSAPETGKPTGDQTNERCSTVTITPARSTRSSARSVAGEGIG